MHHGDLQKMDDVRDVYLRAFTELVGRIAVAALQERFKEVAEICRDEVRVVMRDGEPAAYCPLLDGAIRAEAEGEG